MFYEFCLSTIIKYILIVSFLSIFFVYLLQIDGWENLRKWAAASVVVYGACAASLVASLTCLKSHVDRPLSKNGEGDIRRQFHLSRLTQKGEQDCRNELRMGKDAFVL